MGRIFRNFMSLMRGGLIRLYYCFFGNCHIGNRFRCFRNSSIRTYKSAKISVGDNVKVDYNTVISVINNGNLSIGDNVGIGPNSMIVCHNFVQVGKDTMFGPGVCIYDHDHLFSKDKGIMAKEYKYGSVVIGKSCWFGAGCIILRNTTVGDGCVIGAGTILKGDYPANSVITQHRKTDIKDIK